MNALEFNNKITNLITGFIANIPTIANKRYPNLSPIRFQLLYYLFTIFRLSFHNNNIILNDWET